MGLRTGPIRRLLSVAITFPLLIITASGCTPQVVALPALENQTFQISSLAFEDGDHIPLRYTCQNMDTSPPLHWNKPPAGTQSLALIMEDLDAGKNAAIHWIIFNVPRDNREFTEAIPRQTQFADGTLQGENDFGKVGYSGPCPELEDEHRYRFILYALDSKLDLAAGVSKNRVLQAMNNHIIGWTSLAFTYQKICCFI